jgi:hypothetical protein
MAVTPVRVFLQDRKKKTGLTKKKSEEKNGEEEVLLFQAKEVSHFVPFASTELMRGEPRLTC